MANDPLDPLKKIQSHLDALRRVQNIPNVNITTPHADVSNLQIQFKMPGGRVFSPVPVVPDPLVEWMLEDLAAQPFHDLVTETVNMQKTKGYRPGHVPRAEGLKVLKKRYDKDAFFRARVGGLWLQSRKKEEDALKLLKAETVRANPWPVVERFGFPLAVWLFFLTGSGTFRGVAAQVLKESAAKGGNLEELVASAAQRAPEAENLWGLPPLTHDAESARLKEEMSGLLAERDRLKQEAEEGKKRRESLEEELRKAREENQKVAHARNAAENARAAAAVRTHELETHLESLRGAESGLKKLEKQVKELEHEKARFMKEKEEWEKNGRAVREDRDRLKAELKEKQKSFQVLSKLLAGKELPIKALYQGQILFLVTRADPAPFFDVAKRAGLTLLVHDGQARNAQFENFLEQAWRVFVLGAEGDFQEGALRAVRESAAPAAFLPSLDERQFAALLAVTAKASL